MWDERVRVRDGGADGEVVVARELTKSWSDSGKLAVDRVTFGVPKGQCFGLLGTCVSVSVSVSGSESEMR